jgi:hypothetical protein
VDAGKGTPKRRGEFLIFVAPAPFSASSHLPASIFRLAFPAEFPPDQSLVQKDTAGGI